MKVMGKNVGVSAIEMVQETKCLLYIEHFRRGSRSYRSISYIR